MAQDEFCRQCPQKHDCKKIYENLGNIETPSIIRQVILAFLLPIVIFITSLVIFEKSLKGLIAAKSLQTAISLLLALSVTAVYVFVVRIINKKVNTGR